MPPNSWALTSRPNFAAQATWDASQEARAIEQLIAKGVKGIIVTAGDATTLNPAIDKAIARGIPVITFDSDAPDSQRLCFAGTNNYEAGKVAGKSMVEWLNGEGEVGISTFRVRIIWWRESEGLKTVWPAPR